MATPIILTTTTQDLSTHISLLTQYPNSYSVIYDFLQFLRQTNLRRSDLVVHFGEVLLRNYSSKLGEEVWVVLEQVFVASLDTNHKKLSEETLNRLRKKFPHSSRVRRLEGLKLEAEGRWEEAKTVYDKLLCDDPFNIAVLKRQVAMLKGLGKTAAAINRLNEYLKVYMTDQEAWAELSDLYLSQLLYKNAEFCYEEMILSSPHHSLYHRKYAEILYSTGGLENYKLARSYFAHSLELSSPENPQTTRSLFGLCISGYAISTCKGGKQVKDNAAVVEWAKKRLLAKYQEAAPDKVVLLERVFQKLEIAQ